MLSASDTYPLYRPADISLPAGWWADTCYTWDVTALVIRHTDVPEGGYKVNRLEFGSVKVQHFQISP